MLYKDIIVWFLFVKLQFAFNIFDIVKITLNWNMFEFNYSEVFGLWCEWDMKLWNKYKKEYKDNETFFIEC